MNTNIVSWAWWKQKLTNARGQNGLMRFVFNEHFLDVCPQSSQTDLAWVITGLLQNCPIKFPYLLWSLKGFYPALSSSQIQKAFQSGSADRKRLNWSCISNSTVRLMHTGRKSKDLSWGPSSNSGWIGAQVKRMQNSSHSPLYWSETATYILNWPIWYTCRFDTTPVWHTT